jgi:NAD+ diphosphatase
MTVTLLGSASLLDRQSGRRGDAAYLCALAADPAARFLIMAGHTPLIAADPSGLWFSAAAIQRAAIGDAEPLFLGILPSSQAGYFALSACEASAAKLASHTDLHAPTDIRTIASSGSLPAGDVALAGLARSLFAWHESARHCGWCGAKTAMTDGGWKRRCEPCGKDTFPRLDPVVIMLVTDGESCILAHEPRYKPGMFSCPAGYIEPGEDIAHAVRREIHEELGLTVTDVAITSSQPWPFPHSLMIGCTAICLPGPLNIDPAEIVEARWFTRGEATQLVAGTHPDGVWIPGPQAIAHHLIRAFAEPA